MDVKIIRSKRRYKSAGARIKNNVVEIRVPFWLSRAKTKIVANHFLAKMKKKRKKQSDHFLQRRASRLIEKYFDNKIKDFSIIWSSRLTSTFGLCSPSKREIKISSRLKQSPSWVIDYLIIHELAHFLVSAHNKQFWSLVNRYLKTKQAKSFLKGIRFAELNKL